jgi:hypothetical protein
MVQLDIFLISGPIHSNSYSYTYTSKYWHILQTDTFKVLYHVRVWGLVMNDEKFKASNMMNQNTKGRLATAWL